MNWTTTIIIAIATITIGLVAAMTVVPVDGTGMGVTDCEVYETEDGYGLSVTVSSNGEYTKVLYFSGYEDPSEAEERAEQVVADVGGSCD